MRACSTFGLDAHEFESRHAMTIDVLEIGKISLRCAIYSGKSAETFISRSSGDLILAKSSLKNMISLNLSKIQRNLKKKE
jgi:hypothetical protein